MRRIYLDYAASAPVKPEVKRAIGPYSSEKYGNASSVHQFGQEARAAIDQGRKKAAKFLNCDTDEIIFTSGGTESDNLAILGVIFALGTSAQNRLSIAPASQSQPKRSASPSAHAAQPARFSSLDAPCFKSQVPHIITSKIEHHAVLNTCEWLESNELAEVTYIGVDKEGKVDPKDIKKAVKTNTVLVSIMYANNETGTIQPVRDIGKMIEKLNKERKNKIYFHTDAVQAAGFLNCNTKYLHVHMLSLSGHKLGAPKGIGVLYKKRNVQIEPIIHGGVHEYGKRAGTENVSAIVGLGKAIELINKREAGRIKKLRDYLESKIIKKIDGAVVNGSKIDRLPNISNLSFKNVEGESIVLSLDLEGIAVSTGSACTSGSLQSSHVLMAMDKNPKKAHSSVRFSLGWATKKYEIMHTIQILPKIIKRLRAISPFK